MKIALCTAKFSDNLGDGVIADCQRHLIKSTSGADVTDVDIAARTKFVPSASRGMQKRLFYVLPRALRRLAVGVTWFGWRRKRALQTWELQLQGVDMLLFGGGQVLQDDLWNFPLKLHALVGLALERGIPVAYSCIGVGGNWSAFGGWLIRRALRRASPLSISVRDANSLSHLHDLNPELASRCRQVIDPALCASDVYDEVPVRRDGWVGLGIAHPAELAVGTVAKDFPGEAYWVSFWAELAASLNESGHKVALFTNGSAEDSLFLDQIAGLLPPEIRVVERPSRPTELVQAIRQFDVVIAHRLHALILAHAHGVPIVALEWDKKVSGFMLESGQAKWVFPPSACIPTAIAQACNVRMAEGAQDPDDLKSRLVAEHQRLSELMSGIVTA